MQNIIYANRVDGLGSRLNTIINGFYLAEILDYPENIKFSWTDSTFYGHNNYLLNYEISGNEREIDGYKIIGASVEKKENIFREEFIKKYFMKSYQDGDIIEFPNNSFIDNLKNIFLKNSMLSPCMKLNHIIKDLDYKNYRERAEYIFFNKIGFSSNIKQIFLEGKSRLSEIFDGYIVIHIRSGDAIYGYSKFRTFGSLNTYQTITYELVLYILNLEEKENIILVGDDVSTIDQFIKIINKPNVISINSLRNIDQYSNLELTFFDVGVMSSAKKIYGSYASLVTLATLSNSQVEFINPFENLLENTVYNILKTNYKKNYFLNNYYKAHSLFLRYLYGLKIEIDVKELICLLRKALVCDRSNDKYRIYLIMHFIKLGDFEKAERYLSLILYSRHDEFIKVFFIKFPYFIFNDVFNVFKNLNLNNEMPYLNIQYIISRIYFVIGEIENAIRIAKDIKCYKSYNYVIDYYIQLFDYCLYNKYKEQYIHNL
ncbi:TPA: hypothetical protein ACRT47_001913, partial [Campylobacter jejuni]|nr:hypothetical protein [Campylobacter jejuni]